MQIAKQPIFDVTKQTIFAHEILSRNSGDEFIPPPQQHIFWASIDRKALQLAKQLIAPGCSLFVNVSDSTLSDDIFFVRWAESVIEMAKGCRLTVEVTEQVSDFALKLRWPQLRSLPVQLSLDDFAKENNGLARLHSFDWDVVKFEMGMGDDGLGLNATQHEGLQYCLENQVMIIAEHVESRQQASLALELGFKLQQGFLWAHPLILSARESSGSAHKVSVA